MSIQPALDRAGGSAAPRAPGLMGLATLSIAFTACAPMPVGPSVAVMPGQNKPFEVFVQDDQLCRSWAAHSIGVPGHDAAAQRLLSSSIAGAALGAVAGGLAGGDRGAGTGAAIGTLIGASAGANYGAASAWQAQRRYDIAYQQCMYSKGNLVQSYYGTRAAPPAPPPPPPR